MLKTFFIAIVLFIFGGLGYYVYSTQMHQSTEPILDLDTPESAVTNFKECFYETRLLDPATLDCVSKSGKRFVVDTDVEFTPLYSLEPEFANNYIAEGPALTKQFVTYDSKASFDLAYKELYSHLSKADQPLMPVDIDFTNHIVLGHFYGPYPTLGAFLYPVTILKNDSGYDVIYVLSHPKEGCPAPEQVTYPHSLISMPKLDAPVSYFIVVNETGCY